MHNAGIYAELDHVTDQVLQARENCGIVILF